MVKEDPDSPCDAQHTEEENAQLHETGRGYEAWATSHGMNPWLASLFGWLR
jgi:hypothetical protein